MGLFSSKTKTTVATTVTRAIEDAMLPDSMATGIIRATMNRGDITEHMLEGVLTSVGIRADRMYEYGNTGYVYGLPSGEYKTANQGEQAVKTVLQQIEGTTVEIDYSRYGPPNALHIGWVKLIQNYGYNPATNQIGSLTASKGVPVYLKDMVVYAPQTMADDFNPVTLEQWGTAPCAGDLPDIIQVNQSAIKDVIAHTPVRFQSGLLKEELRVTATWVIQTQTGTDNGLPTGNPIYDTEVFEEVFVIPTTGYNNDKDYFHAKYLKGTQIKYWIYQVGAGTYPTLDEFIGAPPAENGSFFPFLYFRYNKVAEDYDVNSDAYKSSKKLAKYLGMNYQDIIDAINDNPDIGDVEQAMMIMAVPAKSENAAERRYLFDFFDAWYDSTGQFSTEEQAKARARLDNDPSNAKNSIIIQDKRFKMALSNNGIYKAFKFGTLGDIGTCDSSFEEFTESIPYGFTTEGAVVSYDYPVKCHYYRKQITAGMFVELKVVDLRLLYYVDEKYAVTADDTDDILLIPLDRAITASYSILEREELYSRSMHYVFNSKIITKIKWYQTGFFKTLLMIAAIAITLYFGTGGELITALISGASAATISSLVSAMLIEMLIGLVVAELFKIIVKAIGIEAAFIIAVIAAVAGAYQIIANGGLKGAPFASELLSLASGLAKAAVANLEGMMKDVFKEFEEFNAFAEEQTKLLESAQDLLENSVVLSPFVIFGESPEDFYNRTVHSGNIGTVSIDAVSRFVESSLKLPTLPDTIEV